MRSTVCLHCYLWLLPVALSAAPAFAQQGQPSSNAGYPTAAPPTAPGPFTIHTADEKSYLRTGGLLQSALHAFAGDRGRTGNSYFGLSRARLFLDGSFQNLVGFRIMPDFAEGKTVLQDAYIDLRLRPHLFLRSGKAKIPYSMERLEADSDQTFVERSLASNLLPPRDVGTTLIAGPGKAGVEWELGVFDGAPDSVNNDLNGDNEFDLAARVFYQPFLSHPHRGIQAFGIGVGATSGNATESLTPLGFKTAGRSTFFRFSDVATAAGYRSRLSPQFVLCSGSFSLQGEHNTTRQRIHKGSVTESDSIRAFEVQATYVLTGEKTSLRNVTPRREFDPATGRGGAYELALRYSQFRADDALFSHGFADPTVSAKKADAYTVGVNWYLNRQVKAQLDYERTKFNDLIKFSTGAKNREDSVLAELQLQF